MFQLTPDAAHGYVFSFQLKTSAPCHSWARDTCTHLWTSSERETSTGEVQQGGWDRRQRERRRRNTNLWLFGIKLISLLQFHVQAFIRTAVQLGDGRRGGGAHVAVVPAPVAAAAAVGQLAAATLHVSRWRRAGWRTNETSLPEDRNCFLSIPGRVYFFSVILFTIQPKGFISKSSILQVNVFTTYDVRQLLLWVSSDTLTIIQ